MSKPLPEFLRDYLYYDEISGVFTWRIQTTCRTYAGTTVKGYGRVKIFGERYSLNRVAWFLAKGEDVGELYIDHINGDRSDNRIDNLRPATPDQNTFNAKIREDNTSGYKGVSRSGDKWRASVRVDGKRQVEYYKTAEEANSAAIRLRNSLHNQFARNS